MSEPKLKKFYVYILLCLKSRMAVLLKHNREYRFYWQCQFTKAFLSDEADTAFLTCSVHTRELNANILYALWGNFNPENYKALYPQKHTALYSQNYITLHAQNYKPSYAKKYTALYEQNYTHLYAHNYTVYKQKTTNLYIHRTT